MSQRAAKRERVPQTEMGELKDAIFGTNDKTQKSPINSVIPSGNLDDDEIETMHHYNDLRSGLSLLKKKLGLESMELQTEKQMLDKMATLSHISKARDGFAPEILVTRKTKQYQSMRQKQETDQGPSKIDQLLDSASDNAPDPGEEMTGPDAGW